MSPSHSESDADAVGFVLAGGKSRRMGTEKALLEFRGRPLIAHAIEILKAAGLPVSIAGAQPESRARLESFAPVVPDFETDLGPLGGICAALASTAAQYAVFLPVDTPFVPASLVQYLLHHARIATAAMTLVSVNGVPQTFPAVVSRSAHSALQQELQGARLGCLAAFETAAQSTGQGLAQLSAEVLVQSGQVSHPQAVPVVEWFLNLNDESQFRRASSLQGSRVI